MKIFILGFGRHGKDTVAELLNLKLGMSYKSSSLCAAEIFLYDLLKKEKGYNTLEECFADRHSPGMRQRWYEEIQKYNSEDRAKLALEIFSYNDCYVGIRDREELDEVKKRLGTDLITIWVDASDRVPPEDSSSCTVGPDQADFILNNNGTEAELEQVVDRLVNLIRHFNEKDKEKTKYW